MTQEEIIRMARQANILEPIEMLDSNPWRQEKIRELEVFAKLVAQAERERCAKICDEIEGKPEYLSVSKLCAASIRSRGQQ